MICRKRQRAPVLAVKPADACARASTSSNGADSSIKSSAFAVAASKAVLSKMHHAGTVAARKRDATSRNAASSYAE